MDDETQAVGAAFEPDDASPSVDTAEYEQPEVETTADADDAEWAPQPDDPPSVQERIQRLSATTRAERERAAQLEQQLADYQGLTPWTEVITRLADRGYTADQIAAYLDQQAAAQQQQPAQAQEDLTPPFDQWLQKTTGYTTEDLPEYLVPLYQQQFELSQWKEQQAALQQQAEMQQAATLLAAQETELTNAIPAFKNETLMNMLIDHASNRWGNHNDPRTLKQMGEELWQVIQAQNQQAVAAYAQAKTERNASVPPVTAGGAAVPPTPPADHRQFFNAHPMEQSDRVAAWLRSRQGSEV